MVAQKGGIAGDGTFQVGMFHRLDQAQMAFRQREIAAAGQRAQHRDPRALHPQPGQPLVPGAGDAVQDHPGQPDIAVAGKAQRGGGGRLRLAADIDHQDHRPAHARGGFGAAALPLRAGLGHTVIQPHRALGDHQVGPCRPRRDGRPQARPHRPAVEVERGPPRRRAVEGRVDVIRAAFERLHCQPVLGKGAQQAQHHRGLAGARARRRNEESGNLSHGRFRWRWRGGNGDRNPGNTGSFR